MEAVQCLCSTVCSEETQGRESVACDSGEETEIRNARYKRIIQQLTTEYSSS